VGELIAPPPATCLPVLAPLLPTPNDTAPLVNDLLPAMGEQYAGKAFLRKSPITGLSTSGSKKKKVW